MKNKLFVLLSLLCLSLSGLGQTITGYRSATLNDGTQTVYRVMSDGALVQVAKLPSDAVRGRFGGTWRLPYAPEQPATFTPQQFGTGKYFDPNFYMCVDLAGQYSLADQRAYGTNLFSPWTMPISARSGMNRGEAFGYLTEDQVYGSIKGRAAYEMSLADYYKVIYDRVPVCGQGGDTFLSKALLVAYNIETTGFWNRNYYLSDWNTKKSTSIVCEFDGQTRTLEQLDAQGLWDTEYGVRFANRMVLLMKLTRERASSDIKLMWGTSMHQYYSKTDLRGVNHTFQNTYCNVSKIGGDNQGNITLNAPDGTPKSYKLSGSVWDQEDAMHGYYYWFTFKLSQQDYQDIWVDKKSGTQTYPYVWSKIEPLHIVADEKGYLQQCREQMKLNQGKYRPIVRLSATSYEDNVAGVVNGVQTIARIGFSNLQGVLTGGETPKVWQPPYMFYGRYAVTRFFAGADPGWGFHIFPPTTDMVFGDLKQMPIYQHHMHSLTAAYQARHDMQFLESWYPNTTLVEDPDVNLNGSWQNYDGVQAWNATSGGGFNPQKPAFMLRYKLTSAGWTVVVLGGTYQAHGAESTYTIRVPNGGLNGNLFQVTLNGPGAQLFEFTVDKNDSGQTYIGKVVANSQFQRPGYSGRTAAN